MFAKLFNRLSRSAAKPVRRFRPDIESLETREVPAASISSGVLVINGTSANDSVVVNPVGSALVKVTFNGQNQYFARSAITANKVVFNGGDGNDYFNNNLASLRVVAYGGNGNDTMYGDNNSDVLFGEAGDDKLYGWGGNDFLYGGTGNDKLYGGAGYDYLFGQDGSDFLDAGSAGEYVNGGSGYDFNAYQPVVGGATYTDIRQGGSPTCWLVSAISAAAYSGYDLGSRISYYGNNLYRVGMYNTSGVYTNVYVTFDGTINGADARANPYQEGESWVTITQRAYLQSRGLSITTPPSGWADTSILALTGHHATTYNRNETELPSENISRIQTALANHQSVIADTRDSNSDLSTNMLVGWHQYTVLRVETTWRHINLGFGSSFWLPTYSVVVRNPWGYDGGATASGDANDGEIRLSWYDFSRSMDAVIIG